METKRPHRDDVVQLRLRPFRTAYKRSWNIGNETIRDGSFLQLSNDRCLHACAATGITHIAVHICSLAGETSTVFIYIDINWISAVTALPATTVTTAGGGEAFVT